MVYHDIGLPLSLTFVSYTSFSSQMYDDAITIIHSREQKCQNNIHIRAHPQTPWGWWNVHLSFSSHLQIPLKWWWQNMATDTKARPSSLLPWVFTHAWGNAHRQSLNSPLQYPLCWKSSWKMGEEIGRWGLNSSRCVWKPIILLGVAPQH